MYAGSTAGNAATAAAMAVQAPLRARRNRSITGALRFRCEVEHRAVDAVPLPRRRRTVRKDVTEMAAAPRAVHFGARHAVGAIDGRADRPWMRRVETRPAGPRIEFRFVGEELLPAAGARKRPLALFGVERTAARTLRRVAAQDLILLRRQDPPPLFVGLRYRIFSHSMFRVSPCDPWPVCSVALLKHLAPVQSELRLLSRTPYCNWQQRAFALFAEQRIDRLQQDSLETAAGRLGDRRVHPQRSSEVDLLRAQAV